MHESTERDVCIVNCDGILLLSYVSIYLYICLYFLPSISCNHIILRAVGDNITYTCPGIKVGERDSKELYKAACLEGKIIQKNQNRTAVKFAKTALRSPEGQAHLVDRFY